MKSQAMIKQIRAMHKKGHPIRKIAKSLGISRNTVRKHLNEKEESKKETKPKALKWTDTFDWERVIKDAASGVTVKQLYSEHLPPVTYKRFCLLLRSRRKPSLKPACRIPHEPGEKTFVDFSDGIAITCPKTGKTKKSHLFMGTLPFSSRIFGVFVEDQSLPNFLRCHEKMWSYFGGVTRYVVIDNLKAGVKKAHLYDPDQNPTYCDYANETGFAVLPARPYKPRDKANVECGHGVVQRTFYQEVRNEKFYSIAQLNQRWAKFQEELNNKVMKDHGVSRNDRFANEKNKLLPLREGTYEIAVWKEPKVHPDCCVQVDKSFYSVPYQYCGQIVRAKLTDKLLSIYSQGGEHIVTHARSPKQHSTIIDEKHLPPWTLQNSRVELKRCLAQAELIGPNTTMLFESWFSESHPLRYLRRAQGVCRLRKDSLSNEAIEYAVAQAITFKKHRISFIRDCAKSFSNRPQPKLSSLPTRESGSTHLHGRSLL